MTKLKFNTLDISEELQDAIADMGFEEATGIQSVAIPKAMEGVDMIGQAQTGTGKTIAFGIPAIEKVDTSNANPQVIILCPTRELAIQVSEEMQRLAKYKRDLRILPIYGGQPIGRQIRSLKRGTQIIIGTPGRVMDHMRRGTLKLNHINTMILDEADEMLNMGFRDDIETVLLQVPKDRQIMLFSATMPKQILDISNKYLKKPTIFRVKQLHVKLTSDAKEYIVDQGYDPLYGARPLKRFLQHNVETLIGRMLIQQDLEPDTTLTVSYAQDQGLFIETTKN